MRRLLTILGITFVTFLLAAFVFWGTGCACEGPNRFAGINPFRDRAPEWAAQEFFREIFSGRCAVGDEVLCRQAVKSGHVVKWEFATRETKDGTVILYYDVKYEDPGSGPASVALAVRPTASGWQVESYSGIR